MSPSSAAIRSSIPVNSACVSRSRRAAGESGQRPTISGAVERAEAALAATIRSAAFLSRYSWRSRRPPGAGRARPNPRGGPAHVHAAAVLRQQAARVEHLLEDLVVWRELDRGGEIQLATSQKLKAFSSGSAVKVAATMRRLTGRPGSMAGRESSIGMVASDSCLTGDFIGICGNCSTKMLPGWMPKVFYAEWTS